MGYRTVLALGMSAFVALASSSAFAAGDAAKGKKVFNKCKACHTLQDGKHKVGPSLLGVVGRKAGTAKGYKKYKGMKGADWTWDEAAINEYLTDPKKFVKKKNGQRTSMVFKLKKADQRADVIAYLKSMNK